MRCSISKRLIGLVAVAFLCGMYGAVAAPFRVVAFAGASNWPFWVAQEKGFFAKESVDAVLEITPNSVELAKNLHKGRYDLALTAADNIVAYDEGQGEADLGGAASFVGLFGVDNGLLSVMASPDIKSFADLKGRSVSVDAMTTGFAFVLRDVLGRNHIAQSDVQWVRVGGGAQRLAALIKSEQAATLLNSPLDFVAEAKGCTRLLRIQDDLGPYQGIVGGATRETVRTRREDIMAFIRAFHASVAWLADATNKEEAIKLLTSKMSTMDRSSAEKTYATLLEPRSGIYRDLRIDREGMKTILRLRSAYAEPRKTLTDPERYIDESLLKAAVPHL